MAITWLRRLLNGSREEQPCAIDPGTLGRDEPRTNTERIKEEEPMEPTPDRSEEELGSPMDVLAALRKKMESDARLRFPLPGAGRGTGDDPNIGAKTVIVPPFPGDRAMGDRKIEDILANFQHAATKDLPQMKPPSDKSVM